MYFCHNPNPMKYFIGIFLTIFIFSCNSTKEEIAATYFGGEIINPRTNFVLLLKDDKIIDTLLLDRNNRFIETYKNLNEGLYTFKHGYEFQYIYIEPTDSILIRLNNWNFDESLVFSGKGASKNEFLIKLFLKNEKEEKSMYQYFNLEENEFQAKLNSLAKEREKIYKEFELHETSLSNGFKKLTSTAIHFPLYRLKEIYPYYYKMAHKLDEFPPLSENFYDYRKQISLNEANLLSFYPYQNYVVNYLYNLSHQLKEKDSSKNNITVNVLHFLTTNIESEEIKNTLLKRIVVNDFLKSESTCSINEETLNIFLENCTNEAYLKQVKDLVNDSKYVINKEELHNFNIIPYNREQTDILSIIENKNTVIYFWSPEYMSTDYIVSRIKFLEKKHPNTLFIGINMNSSLKHLAKEPNLKRLDINKQYVLTEDSYAHKYLTSKYPRSIIINKEGVVVNGFTYLDSKKFSSELKKLQKK